MFIPPTFRIATASHWCSAGAPAVCSPLSNAFLPTAVIRDQKRLQPLLEQAPGKSKSLNGLTPQSGSRSCRNDGLSNERSPGSVASAVLLEISIDMPEPSQPLSVSL